MVCLIKILSSYPGANWEGQMELGLMRTTYYRNVPKSKPIFQIA